MTPREGWPRGIDEVTKGRKGAPRRLHGVWPVVVDEGMPTGIRFAAAHGEAGRPVARAADLPDAEVTLRTFGSRGERDGYLAAAREFGGEAVAATALLLRPEREGEDECEGEDIVAALLVRRDRAGPRVEADAPAEAAVRLVGSLPPGEFGWMVAEAERREEVWRRRDEWKAFWGPIVEDLVAGSDGRMELVDKEGSQDQGVKLRWRPGSPAWLLLERRPEEPGTIDLVFQRRGWDSALVEAHGFHGRGDDWWSTPLRRGVEWAGALAARLVALAAASEAATTRARLVARLREVLDEPRAMVALRGAATGFPIVTHERHYVGWRVDPETGLATTVHASHARMLWDAGLMEPLAWDDRLEGTRVSGEGWRASGAMVLGASPLGRLVAAGADDEATAMAMDAAREAAGRLRDGGGGRFPASPRIGSAYPDGVPAWEPPPQAWRPTLAGGARPRLPRKPIALAVAAAWIAHGLLREPGVGD